MNWGDTLCGVEVTPESWQMGGLIRLVDGERWRVAGQFIKRGPGRIHDYFFGADEIATDCAVPIFPPRGFAGKTDAEMWREVFGSIHAIDIASINARKSCIEVSLSLDGNIGIETGDVIACIYFNGADRAVLDAIILALQNAQVLAARLEVRNGER